jgi:hypothetical protein
MFMGLSVWLLRQFARQLRPQVLDQLAHRLGDGFDVFEVENFLVDARSISAEWMIRPSKTRDS